MFADEPLRAKRLSTLPANTEGNAANEIYNLPSTSAAKARPSTRHKVFRPSKGKHHMVMHDDRHVGNIMYLRE